MKPQNYKTGILIVITLITALTQSCKRGNADIISINYTTISCSPPYITEFYAEIDSDFVGKMTYTWDFGDGNISGEADPVHAFTNPGLYTIKLKIENYKETDEKTIILDLKETMTQKVQFDYTSENENYRAPAQLYFSNFSNYTNSFFWNFGDKSGSEDKFPVHVYNEPGTYKVILRANCNGDTVYSNQNITIYPQPTNITINEVQIWMPEEFRRFDYFIKVKYDIFTEVSGYPDKIITINSFPAIWELNTTLFFFNGVFDAERIVFEIWDADAGNSPVYDFYIETIDLQKEFYPTKLTWDSNDGFEAKVLIDYD